MVVLPRRQFSGRSGAAPRAPRSTASHRGWPRPTSAKPGSPSLTQPTTPFEETRTPTSVRPASKCGKALRTPSLSGALRGTAQTGAAHDAAYKHDARRHGAVRGRGGCYHEGGLRGIRGASARSGITAGQVVVLDNLAAHTGEGVRELVEGGGCESIYLPPASPDLNPTEAAFSKVKALLQQAGARACGAPVEAMGRTLSAITARDVRGFFERCGYRQAGRSPWKTL